MVLNKSVSILLVTLWLSFLDASGQQSIFKTYTVGDGMVNNSVRRIYQDSKGFLWIATWEGLSKYDGNRFTNFTESNGLSHSLVNDVIELPSGEIYVAMNNGCVDLIHDDQIARKKIFSNIIVNRFQFSRTGALLALTDTAGIAEVNRRQIKYLNKSNGSSCYGMVTLNDSLIAVAADTLPVQIFDKQFKIWSAITKRIIDGVSTCVYKDLDNRLWVGTTKGLRLVSIDYHKHQTELQSPPAPFDDPLLSQGYVNCMFQEQNGNYWVGTAQGLIHISKQGQLKLFSEHDGLPSKFVSFIFQDRENNLWLGTDLGLAKLIGPSAQLFEGQARYASVMERVSTKEMVIATDRFFYRYNFDLGKIENILSLQQDKSFTYVTNSSASLFIYGNELYHYDIRSNRLTSREKLTSSVGISFTGSATTPDGRTVFLPISRAIIIYSNGKCLIDSSFNMRVNNILADRHGYIWLGTWDDGLYRAKYDVVNQKWTEITHVTQLPDNHVRSLFEDREGNMWVGTRYNGVLRIDESRPDDGNRLALNQQKGLSSNWIIDMTEDPEGNIWVVNKFGIDKLRNTDNGFSLFNYSRIINFFPNVNIIRYASGNRLICSSAQGLCEIKDEKLEQTSAKEVYLTKVTLAGAGKTVFTFNNAPQSLSLPYSTNNALFEFTSPTFVNEKAIFYSYRLKGSNDTAWSHASNSHSVQYASLAPGHYQFEVRMLGWNGHYGPVTSFLFTVNPPFWKRWWFYLLIVLLLSVILYRLYRYRIDQLLRVQMVRNTIATDLHDDIGSTLTNISILSELSKKNIEQPQAATQFLKRITEESVASQQALDDIIWSVNSRNDNIEELQARMRRYAGELFEGDSLKCEFSVDNTESSRLNMEQRRDVYLVFKECLNNIHKHASAKNVSIKVSVTNGILNMEISDDGKGFNQDLITHRNGLQNMRTRVAKWAGDLKIDSRAEVGTKIEITMPVKSSLLK